MRLGNVTMILKEVDSCMQEHAPTNIPPDDEVRVCKGNYIGIVRPNENQYEFLVRDMRREGPTIYGSGVDFLNASIAVTQLLDALIGEP
jgi:hypothetical protein